MNYELKLYVAGDNAVSRVAVETVRKLRAYLSDEISLEIVDILANPEISRSDRVVATPLLVRCTPQPVRKMIGDLTDHSRVISALQLGNGLAQESGS